jgi:NTP pyrophosphatase (non-canonical NTP hydrolase)
VEDLMTELSFNDAINLYRSIYHRFEKIEGRSWGVEGAIIELVKQVGELAKHIMLTEKYYFTGRENLSGYETGKEQIGDELADIFAQLIRIADYYQIDLVEAHIQARKEEEESLIDFGV